MANSHSIPTPSNYFQISFRYKSTDTKMPFYFLYFASIHVRIQMNVKICINFLQYARTMCGIHWFNIEPKRQHHEQYGDMPLLSTMRILSLVNVAALRMLGTLFCNFVLFTFCKACRYFASLQPSSLDVCHSKRLYHAVYS